MLATPFQACGLITLTTDFGLSDPYVGVMKGAILSRHPAACLVDLTHQIPAFQPHLAGFWLARSWRYFPAGTIHLAVVDPGVGTERGMVALQVAEQVFIAPDNGLLEPVWNSSQEGYWRTFQLSDLGNLQLSTPSHTFHGRDIFAPLVAEIAANRYPLHSLGKLIQRRRAQAEPAVGEGRIVWVDKYGNLITDIEATCLERFKDPVLWFRNSSIPLRKSYGFAARGALLGLVNSWGTLEIALAQGNAQQHLQAEPGESVKVGESPPSAASPAD